MRYFDQNARLKYNPIVPETSDRKDKMIKVAVGLSGGIDSSVSAYLLKKQGYAVHGVHLQCWDYKADGCSGEQDRADAVKVASRLEIPFTALNFEKEYKEKVISYFYNEYRNGRTPNPDVMCNKEIKFGLFLNWALEQGFDYVATGHYAAVRESQGVYTLMSGVDVKKDQSYFLYLLGQRELSRVLFPLGDMLKEDVRKVGEEIGLHNAKKKDSVGICFVGEVNIQDFIKREISENPGDVVDIAGEVIGKHIGISFYTIGQRHGFTLTKYFGVPMYVIAKDVSRNLLVVGDAPQANRRQFSVRDCHWISQIPQDSEFECFVRIRHLGELFRCKVYRIADYTCNVVLENDAFGVTPGQSAVLYSSDLPSFPSEPAPRYVLGGGVIA